MTDRRSAIRDLLRDLLAWESYMGGFEAEIWRRVRDMNHVIYDDVCRDLQRQAQGILSAEKPAVHVKVLDFRIADLELSVRSFNVLSKNGYVTIADLLLSTRGQLLRLPGMGRRSVNEIEETLRGLGLQLGNKTFWEALLWPVERQRAEGGQLVLCIMAAMELANMTAPAEVIVGELQAWSTRAENILHNEKKGVSRE